MFPSSGAFVRNDWVSMMAPPLADWPTPNHYA